MPNRKQNQCPRCFIGVDDDGDGDCRLCAGWSELKLVEARQSINQTISRAVQIARDAALEEVRAYLARSIERSQPLEVLRRFRRRYPKHGDVDIERVELQSKQIALGRVR
jgi:hypothetical protein